MRPWALSERMRAPLPMMWRSLPGVALSLVTAAGTSPVSRVEFGHFRVGVPVLATYFAAWLRASLNGLSWVFQKPSTSS